MKVAALLSSSHTQYLPKSSNANCSFAVFSDKDQEQYILFVLQKRYSTSIFHTFCARARCSSTRAPFEHNNLVRHSPLFNIVFCFTSHLITLAVMHLTVPFAIVNIAIQVSKCAIFMRARPVRLADLILSNFFMSA